MHREIESWGSISPGEGVQSVFRQGGALIFQSSFTIIIIDLLTRCIAGNENEMSFFTSWSRCPPLGHYWFLVDAVIFRKTGFDLNLRILRSREDEEKSMTRICPKCNHNLDSSPDASNSSDDTMNISDIAASLQVRKSPGCSHMPSTEY